MQYVFSFFFYILMAFREELILENTRQERLTIGHGTAVNIPRRRLGLKFALTVRVTAIVLTKI